MADASVEAVAAIMKTAAFEKHCAPLYGKLRKLVNLARENAAGPQSRVVLLAKRLCERCVKDALSLSDKAAVSRLWIKLKNQGCIYLPGGDQDRVIDAVIAVSNQQSRAALSRSALTDLVLTQLSKQAAQPGFPSRTFSPGKYSKTNVGHVLQLLIRSGAFTKAEVTRNGKALWQLREDCQQSECLRQMQDFEIVKFAQQEGIFLSPADWSLCLFRSVSQQRYCQSILDRQHYGMREIADLLRNSSKYDIFPEHSVELFVRLAALPDVADQVTDAQVQCALEAVAEALQVLISTYMQSPRNDVSHEDVSLGATLSQSCTVSSSNSLPSNAATLMLDDQSARLCNRRLSEGVDTLSRPIRGRGSSLHSDEASERQWQHPCSAKSSNSFDSNSNRLLQTNCANRQSVDVTDKQDCLLDCIGKQLRDEVFYTPSKQASRPW